MVGIEEVDDFFQEKVKKQLKKISTHEIIKTVCGYYNIRQTLLKSAERSDKVAICRQVIMYLLRKQLGLKLEEIAYILRRKDNTTVIHGINKVNNLLIKDQLFKEEIDRVVSSFSQST